MIRITTVALTLALAAILGLPAVSTQAAVPPSHISGLSFGGEQETPTADPCIHIDVFLGTQLQTTRFSPGSTTTSGHLSLEIEQHNSCTEEVESIFILDADLTPADLTGDVRGGSLNMGSPIFSLNTESNVDVAIHLTYSLAGPITVDPQTFHFSNGANCHSLTKTATVAITGTVTLDSTVYASGNWSNGNVGDSQEGCT
jgi:hypothetical protein